MQKDIDQASVSLDSRISVDGETYRIGDLSYEDISIRNLTGRTVYLRGEGRNKEYRYCNGCMTNIGDLEEEQWIKVAKCLIREKYHENEFLSWMTEWVIERCPWHTKAIDRERTALSGVVERLFDNELWVDFIPFNEKHRPDILTTAEIVVILPECCKKPGRTTKVRLMHDASPNGREIETYCPHCGRWARVDLLKQT